MRFGGSAVPARHSQCQGFTLVEVVVATALFTGAVAGVLQLFLIGAAATLGARDATFAAILASQKLNELTSTELVNLVPSAPDAWMRATAGYVDYLDSAGALVATGGVPPGSTAYVRRWSITPILGDSTAGVIVQVSAGRLRRGAVDGMPLDAQSFDVARVVGVRTGLAS